MGGMPGDATLGIQRCLPPAPSTTQLQPHTGRVDTHSYPTDAGMDGHEAGGIPLQGAWETATQLRAGPATCTGAWGFRNGV